MYLLISKTAAAAAVAVKSQSLEFGTDHKYLLQLRLLKSFQSCLFLGLFLMIFCISKNESNLDWYSKCQKQNSSAWWIPLFWIFAHQSAGVGIIVAYETILLFLRIWDIMLVNPLVTVAQLEFKCGHLLVWRSGCRVVSGCAAEAKWWPSINKDQMINSSLFSLRR